MCNVDFRPCVLVAREQKITSQRTKLLQVILEMFPSFSSLLDEHGVTTRFPLANDDERADAKHQHAQVGQQH